jgi:hypothetical protein
MKSLGKSGGSGGSEKEVVVELKQYLSEEIFLASALSHKWLGVEAGEAGRSGEAIAYLSWAKAELADGGSGKLASIATKRGRDMNSERKERVVQEAKVVKVFLDTYTRENDTVSPQSSVSPEII